MSSSPKKDGATAAAPSPIEKCESLEIASKKPRKIRDIQSSKSDCGVVAHAAGIEPIAAVRYGVEGGVVRASIALTTDTELVEWEVEQSDPAVQRLAEQRRHAVELRRGKARSPEKRQYVEDSLRLRRVVNNVSGIRVGVKRNIRNIAARIVRGQGIIRSPAIQSIEVSALEHLAGLAELNAR